MFSGIVEEIGVITSATDGSGGRRLTIAAKLVTSDVKLGDSISCSGACLTVCEFNKESFAVEATFETLRRTKLGAFKTGSKVNLERALRVSDRLGGHIVSGHVDGLGAVSGMSMEGFSKVIEFSLSAELAPFFVEKGSVTIDGVSLTVSALSGASKGSGQNRFTFSVALIPHTLSVTTLGELKVGDPVNVEADLIGKYVARLVGQGYAENINKGGLTLQVLSEQGYT